MAKATSKLAAKLKGKMAEKALVPHIVITARAGTGKTTTLVEGLKVLRGETTKFTPSPQQAVIWDALKQTPKTASACFVAFNKAIATELQRRVPEGVDAMTMHSLGYKAVKNTFGSLKISDFRVMDIISEILKVDVRELRRQPSKMAMIKAVQELVGLCKNNLADGTEEELGKIVQHYDVEMDCDTRMVFDLVPKVLLRCREVDRDRSIDFDDMVWLPVVLDLPIAKYDLLLIDESQDLGRCQQALAKKAGKRLVFCGDDKQCHPAGTMITLTGGREEPIERLRVGDMLATFNPNQGRLAGTLTQGRRVEAIGIREFDGTIHSINGTRCTPNHRWPTKLDDSKRDWTALYLMELGDGSFRIGITQLMHKGANGFGPGLRARQEGAVKLWLLDVIEDRNEAREHEFKNSLRYQIPQRAQYEETDDCWSRDLIDEGFPPNVDDLLNRYGRLYEFPIWEPGGTQHVGTKYLYTTQACNLIPTVNMIARRNGDSQDVVWELLDLDLDEWSGKVWSLKVQPTERDHRLYLADGNVTSNSIYGFAGADSESIKRLQKELAETPQGCINLPLTVTRRCGRAIVREAQVIVPGFEAHESNPEGTVTSMPYAKGEKGWRDVVKPGDMVICRVNAPLVSECFRFIRAGKKAVIQGRDIGAGLVKMVDKMGAISVPDLVGKLSDWKHRESEKELAKRNPSESRIIGIQDRHDCLLCFTEGAKEVDDVRNKIKTIFTDDKTEGIKLSSGHKSKGLEANRVFLLFPKGAGMPHQMAKSAWQKEQEMNLLYVAITRAISELIYVREEE